jgi:hypothetical protein
MGSVEEVRLSATSLVTGRFSGIEQGQLLERAAKRAHQLVSSTGRLHDRFRNRWPGSVRRSGLPTVECREQRCVSPSDFSPERFDALNN